MNLEQNGFTNGCLICCYDVAFHLKSVSSTVAFVLQAISYKCYKNTLGPIFFFGNSGKATYAYYLSCYTVILSLKLLWFVYVYLRLSKRTGYHLSLFFGIYISIYNFKIWLERFGGLHCKLIYSSADTV